MSATIDLAALLCDQEIGQRTLDELMDSLLGTAIEGGSTYWCRSIRIAPGMAQPKPADHGEDASDPWYSVAFRAKTSMRVIDEEGGKFVLDRKAGHNGLRLLLSGQKCRADLVTQLIGEKACADAEVADVWLQLAALGEVRYG